MHLRLLALACVLFAPTAVFAASGALPQLTADECAVWQRELSFARSVAERDAAGFASHLGENAAFGASTREPIRGREAIARQWAGIVEGKRTVLRWYPTRVTISPGAPDTAWSSGPSLFEVLDPKAKDRFHIGAFHSVWHRDADGVWRVLFDDGVQPRPATAEEVAAFHAGRADCGSTPAEAGNPNRS